MTLRPDAALQQRVLLAGALVLAGGGAVALHMPVSPWLRAAVLAAWLGLQAAELYRFAVAAASWSMLRFTGNGWIAGRHAGCGWTPLTLQPGTFVTSRFAWLRLAAPTGEMSQVLVLAARCCPADWRRLQVVLRFRR